MTDTKERIVEAAARAFMRGVAVGAKAYDPVAAPAGG